MAMLSSEFARLKDEEMIIIKKLQGNKYQVSEKMSSNH